MITFDKVVKVKEDQYLVTSKPCPGCQDSFVAELQGLQLFLYNQGANIMQVFPNLSVDDRERFISGYCATCWDNLFAEIEEEE